MDISINLFEMDFEFEKTEMKRINKEIYIM